MKHQFAILLCMLAAVASSQVKIPGEWLTFYEKSGCTKTPSYSETIGYCKKLQAASPWVKYTSFGVSPQGRDLPLVILSKDGIVDAAKARNSGKAIVLIQSGIHSGEIDGKDASLMLMRDIAITRRYASLLDNVILLFVPIYSVDAHERSGPYNRINQNGPEEMGWRVTAQNLNLNRDYMKADAPETQSMLKLFSQWLPDFYVDCHVTDGIDFQYDVTYAVETGPNLDAHVRAWIANQLMPPVLQKVEQSGHLIFSYVFPREDNDLTKGLSGGGATPRFSTGYAALQNRPALLIETHMLKPYKTRVDATYQLLLGVAEEINHDPQRLRSLVRTADAATIEAGRVFDPAKALPMTLSVSDKSRMVGFKGFETRFEPSPISGTLRRIYTGKPVDIAIPFFDDIIVKDSASIPLGYLVPQEWDFVPRILKLHGVAMAHLSAPASVEVESYKFSDVKFNGRPYEGRNQASYKTQVFKEVHTYPKGTLLVLTAQRAGKVAMHLLEPKGPDAFVAWGFFNAIFEQKEYAESYVMETIGAEMLAKDAALKALFDQNLAADSTFAGNPEQRLNWLYLHSKWADPLLNVYPVARIISATELEKLQTK